MSRAFRFLVSHARKGRKVPPVVLLVGNKTDLSCSPGERVVSALEGQRRAKEIEAHAFHEISVRESVDQVSQPGQWENDVSSALPEDKEFLFLLVWDNDRIQIILIALFFYWTLREREREREREKEGERKGHCFENCCLGRIINEHLISEDMLGLSLNQRQAYYPKWLFTPWSWHLHVIAGPQTKSISLVSKARDTSKNIFVRLSIL